MPEATTRLAALRSGQVDWIEVPPPDAVPSLKQAGFEVVTGVYPHVWPWVLNMDKADSPLRDVRVRQAANYCVDRDGPGQAAERDGLYRRSASTPRATRSSASPKNAYTFDPAKAKTLLKEAGYGPGKPVKAKIMISTAGSGQMLPLPMNEFIQQTMKQCGFDITFEVVEWGAMLVAFRNRADGPQAARLRRPQHQPRLLGRLDGGRAGSSARTSRPRAQTGGTGRTSFDGAAPRIERCVRSRRRSRSRRAGRTSSWWTRRRGSGSCMTATRAR